MNNRWVKSGERFLGISILVILTTVTCGAPPSSSTSDVSTSGAATTTSTAPIGVVGGFPLVDTNQLDCYNDQAEIPCPVSGGAFSGQDAQYFGTAPSYVDHSDGTVSDQVTGLMWQQDPVMASFDEAPGVCSAASTAGYNDWRVPTIKELYSLMDFSGSTGTAAPDQTTPPADAFPYLDANYFTFYYGTDYSDPNAGDRYIDSQYVSSTEYVSTVFDGVPAFFGVNFADGRIKGYPQSAIRSWFVRCVRGNEDYGKNLLVDNGDDTVTDEATNLMWTRFDSGGFGVGDQGALDWEHALEWCENLDFAGHDDWRLPNAKELESVVDYTRAPDVTQSAAISPLFETSIITNEAGQLDAPYFWSSTTHLDGQVPEARAAYVSFGRAMGYMDEAYMDVHGAGAQRSDPKSTVLSTAQCGMGPQGDCNRIYNYARCVRDL